MTDKKNPFDIDLDEKVEPKTDNKVVETAPEKAGTEQDETAPAAEEKPKKRTRRTKEEIEAAKAVEDGQKQSEGADPKMSFNDVDYEKFPLSAVSGQVTGVVKLNGAVPILEIALVGWVGEAPVSVAADQIGDVEQVLKDLRKAAKDAQKS